MKEDYMHFLWRMRFLPTRNLTLAKGEELEIIKFGEYNKNESGPDFFHAKLIIDGMMWFGHVEFHLKASDWFKHRHQNDPAYNHVILHVVWENDMEVICQDKLLPTLILSEYVKNDFSASHLSTRQGDGLLPCSYELDSIEEIYIEKEKESALTHRLFRKTKDFHQNPNDGFSQVLYELIAVAFGAKVNRDPFWQLTKEIPIKRLLKLGKNKRVATLMTASGVYPDLNEQRSTISKMEAFQWKKKGLHPKGSPEIRVEQFAHFIQHFDFDYGFMSFNANEMINYFRTSFTLAERNEVKFTKSFQDLVIINAFVPFLFWVGEKRGEEKWQTKGIQLLELIPAETNHLTKFLKNAGFKISSAYDSQSLLELYSLRCSRKKCLTCGIGNKILGR